MIAALSLAQVAAALSESLGAHRVGADVHFQRVSTDTRSLQAGDLFVALRGERFDAHDFLAQAAQQACALVVERQDSSLALPQLVVTDSTRALGEIAALNRAAFNGPLVAVTGSSGKTTVKALLALILAECGPTLATQGNLNNHIGVPFTLLDLAPEHRYAVIEMGASAEGEIAYLCTLARPQVALINNVMPAHIEGFGSLAGVARAKGEIYQGLRAGGTAVVNLDDAFADQWLAQMPAGVRVLTVSLHNPAADFSLRLVAAGSATEAQQFVLLAPGAEQPVQLAAPGEHNLRNALAASACAWAAGASLAQIARGLAAFTPVAGRMSQARGHAGALVIDDSYNANPGSVRAAIEVLAAQPGTRLLVLGDMAELGEGAAEQHAELGRHARDKGLQGLLTLGPLSARASAAFGVGGQGFEDFEQLLQALRERLNAQTTVLVKGSRSARMDRVVRALLERGDQS